VKVKVSVASGDEWGVRGPDGWIRAFSTQDKAEMYARAMEGKEVTLPTGQVISWTGLSVVHRYIPEWEEVPFRETIKEEDS
jgi:hypothetical protein